LSIWQAITLVGDVRERSDEIELEELEAVLAEAESLLIDAVAEAAQRADGLTRQRNGLSFWKAAHDTPSDHIFWSRSTSVIPFPGRGIPKALSPHRFDERTTLRTSVTPGINQPAQLPDVNPGSAESKTQRRSFPRRGVHLGWALRSLLLVVMVVLPMIAI